MSEKQQGRFTFKGWYEKHKEELAAKRARRYAEDPEYRAKALAASRSTYQKIRARKLAIPQQYKVRLRDLQKEAPRLAPWRIYEWRRRGYIPELPRVGANVWLTSIQVSLLCELDNYFFKRTTRRTAKSNKAELDALITDIKGRWHGLNDK